MFVFHRAPSCFPSQMMSAAYYNDDNSGNMACGFLRGEWGEVLGALLPSFCLCSGCHTPEMRLTRGVGRCEGFCSWEEHVKGQSTRVQCCAVKATLRG